MVNFHLAKREKNYEMGTFLFFSKSFWKKIYSAYSKLRSCMEASSLFIAMDMVRQMIAT